MQNVSRFTISVPTRLLEALDQKLTRDGESRSAVIRRLVEEALQDAEEQGNIARYINSYREQPQTEDEFGWSDEVAREHLAETPWT